MPESSDGGSQKFSRRRLISGAGAVGVLAVPLLDSVAAHASSHSPEGAEVASRPEGSPIATSIASAPRNGLIYRNACMYDFRPFNPAAQATWGGSGLYSAGTATSMRATIDVPIGALVADVEWYVYNNSGSSVFPALYQYAPGQGTISAIGGSAAIPSASAIQALRVGIPSAMQGPFPMGSMVLASLATPSTGTVQINGVRVGFTTGAGATGLLPNPVRAYDSRVGNHKFTARSTRTISLGAPPVGASAVYITLTAIGATKSGFLKVYGAQQSIPAMAALHFDAKATISNTLLVALSSAKHLKIYASAGVHVVVDVIGYVS